MSKKKELLEDLALFIKGFIHVSLGEMSEDEILTFLKGVKCKESKDIWNKEVEEIE